jgi:hypothetical protein
MPGKTLSCPNCNRDFPRPNVGVLAGITGAVTAATAIGLAFTPAAPALGVLALLGVGTGASGGLVTATIVTDAVHTCPSCEHKFVRIRE